MPHLHLYEHEMTYAITAADVRTLRRRLTASAAGATAGYVHTLTFASCLPPALTDGRETGEEARFTLRYFDNDPSYLWLERRLGREADFAAVAEAECRALLQGETDWLRARQDPVLRDFHRGLTERMLLPQRLVTYHRETYELEGLDLYVALDTEVRTTLEHMDFLDPERLARYTADQEGRMLLEVGYSDTIPDAVLCLLEEVAPSRRPLTRGRI